MDNKKTRILTAFVLSFSVLSLMVAANALSTVVKDTYSKSFIVGKPSVGYYMPSCNIPSNYESGRCSYVYACYAILPKGSSNIDNAVQRECAEISDGTTYTFNINFVPPRGMIYAITTFNTIINYTYNPATTTWSKVVDIPVSSITAEEVVSLCPTGSILKSNLCIPAQKICIDQLKTNLCTNPYTLYALDYNGNGFADDISDPSHICADRQDDLICDTVVDELCADTNNNGVCDSTDIALEDTVCNDKNGNGVCDDVELAGVFCTKSFNPVCSGNTTYPNKCFAEGVGITAYTIGECVPISYKVQCYSNSDCAVPCPGVVSSCNANQCIYGGECNPTIIQCTVSSDCPSSYCVGVSPECTANKCQYSGKCITKPEPPPTIWAEIKTAWTKFWAAILSTIGWL